jgi:hypothetical protein
MPKSHKSCPIMLFHSVKVIDLGIQLGGQHGSRKDLHAAGIKRFL